MDIVRCVSCQAIVEWVEETPDRSSHDRQARWDPVIRMKTVTLHPCMCSYRMVETNPVGVSSAGVYPMSIEQEYRQLVVELIEAEERRVSNVGGPYENHSHVRRWMEKLAQIDKRQTAEAVGSRPLI